MARQTITFGVLEPIGIDETGTRQTTGSFAGFDETVFDSVAAIGALNSASATISGAGLGASTGTGSLDSAAAAVSGSGVAGSAAIGTLTSASATISGSGVTGLPEAEVSIAQARTLLSRRDWVREPGVVFSGGAWFDLGNIADPNPAIVARAEIPEESGQTFVVDLGATRSINLFHFQMLWTSCFALVRVQASTAADFATLVYDSDWRAAWADRESPYALSPFGNWHLPGPVEELEESAWRFNRYFVPSTVISARYLRVALRDRLTRKRCMIGCFGALEAWPISFGPNVECQLDLIDGAVVQTAPYGSTFANRSIKRRRWNIGFDHMSSTEALERALVVAAQKGKHDPLVFIPWLNQPTEIERLAVYGVLARADFSSPFFSLFDSAFVIEEII